MSKKNIRDLLREVLKEEASEQVGADEQVDSNVEEQRPVPALKKRAVPTPPPKVSKDEGEEGEEVVIEATRRRPAREVPAQPVPEPPAPLPQPPRPLAPQPFDIFKLLDDPDISNDERRAIISVAWKKFGPREEFLRYMDLLTQDQVTALLRHIADHPQCDAAKILAERLLEYMAHGGVR